MSIMLSIFGTHGAGNLSRKVFRFSVSRVTTVFTLSETSMCWVSHTSSSHSNACFSAYDCRSLPIMAQEAFHITRQDHVLISPQYSSFFRTYEGNTFSGHQSRAEEAPSSLLVHFLCARRQGRSVPCLLMIISRKLEGFSPRGPGPGCMPPLPLLIVALFPRPCARL